MAKGKALARVGLIVGLAASIAVWKAPAARAETITVTHWGGQFYGVPPPGGGAVRPNAGPVAVGTFNYVLSEQSVAVREAANAAMKKIAERRGLGRFMALTETQGAYASHPLGGCRMAESPDLGVTDDTGAVYGYEGLFCIDSSIIPTSLGVNPSLTIAAVAEPPVASMGSRMRHTSTVAESGNRL